MASSVSLEMCSSRPWVKVVPPSPPHSPLLMPKSPELLKVETVRGEQSKPICSVQQIQNSGQFPQPSLKRISITLLPHEELKPSGAKEAERSCVLRELSWLRESEPFG